MLQSVIANVAAKVEALSAEAVIALFTIVLAISTTFLWWETRRLASQAKQQASDFQRSVAAAEMAAKAAQRSAEIANKALHGTYRPIIILNVIVESPALPKLDEPNPAFPFRLLVLLENVGSMPATLESCLVDVRPLVRDRKNPFEFPTPARSEFETLTTNEVLERREALKVGQKRGLAYDSFSDAGHEVLTDFYGVGLRCLICLGLLSYRDPFGIRRELGFTYHYDMTGDDERWEPFEGDEFSFDREVEPEPAGDRGD